MASTKKTKASTKKTPKLVRHAARHARILVDAGIWRAVRGKVGDLEGKVSDLEDTIEEMQGAHKRDQTTLEGNLADLEAERDALLRDLKAARADRDKSEQDALSVVDECANVKTALAKANAEAANLAARLVTAGKEIAHYKHEAEGAAWELNAVRDELANVKARLELTREELDNVTAFATNAGKHASKLDTSLRDVVNHAHDWSGIALRALSRARQQIGVLPPAARTGLDAVLTAVASIQETTEAARAEYLERGPATAEVVAFAEDSPVKRAERAADERIARNTAERLAKNEGTGAVLKDMLDGIERIQPGLASAVAQTFGDLVSDARKDGRIT